MNIFQKFERINRKSSMTSVLPKIKRNILIGQLNGFCRAVNGVYQTGITPHSITRKTACITKHIEYVPSFGILLQQHAVLSLINKESCFLTFLPIYLKFQPVFNSSRI